jgi:hypothetical protein
MNCEKCNIKLNLGEECKVCWKKKESRTVPMYHYTDWNVPAIDYNYRYTLTAGSTTSAWDNWDEDDWYITTTTQ